MRALPADFQTADGFNPSLVDRMERFLLKKEDRLARQILECLLPSIQLDPASLSTTSTIKLSDVVEGFSKKVRQIGQFKEDILQKEAPEKIIKKINAILWELTEVLEGSAVELFQQVEQAFIDQWTSSKYEIVGIVKELFVRCIDDLIWVIRRLETALREFKNHCERKNKQSVWKWFSMRDTHIDSHLLKNLQKTERFLKERYEAFKQQYETYLHLTGQAERELNAIRNYPIFALLDRFDQEMYLKLYQFLRLLQFHRRYDDVIGKEIVRVLKFTGGSDEGFRIFDCYFKDIQACLFKSSLEWKALLRQESGSEGVCEKLKKKLYEVNLELAALTNTIGAYRKFLLKSDANPYARSRWGFSEWSVAPESEAAKKMASLIYLSGELSEDFCRLALSMRGDKEEQKRKRDEVEKEIESLLHEMGQPLISLSMMQDRVDKLLEQIWECDELGSCDLSTVRYVEETLSKAMRCDWKYNILQQQPLFHRIYSIHQGLAEQRDDPAHAFRLGRLELLLKQIERSCEKKEDHLQEITLDMNDVKTYLQDFLALTKRCMRENDPFLEETTYKLRQQLLEYRYLFGQFFSHLDFQSDDKTLRSRFLFVDCYFESIEKELVFF